MDLLWESVFLGGDRGHGFEKDLQAIGATDPSEELAEFLRQARTVHFTLTEARSRFVDIDSYRIEMLAFMADYDVIVCPAMPTPAKPHGHGLVEIRDFSHLMVHNLTGWPAAVVRCGTSQARGCPSGCRSSPGHGRMRRRWRSPLIWKRCSEDGVRLLVADRVVASD